MRDEVGSGSGKDEGGGMRAEFQRVETRTIHLRQTSRVGERFRKTGADLCVKCRENASQIVSQPKPER